MLKPLSRETAGTKDNLPVKVLQFGEGNFLRAFVDWMIDVMNEKAGFGSAVQVVQPIPQGMGDALNKQGGLYHVVLNGIQQGKSLQETRLIKCVKSAINPFTQYPEYLKAAENPDLQFIVSNTTEAGIVFSESDNSPKVLPQTFPGKLTAFLHHRYEFYKGSTGKGLVIMPCELIEKNGAKLKAAILEYVSLWKLSDGFRQWIEKENTFCNTLVDRIVPGFPKETITEIKAATGFDDNLVVTAEPFHLWVIEGPESLQQKFPARKSGLEVKFVNDLTPYRTRKVRILNGAHTSLVPVAYLAGLRTVRESVNDPNIGTYLQELVFQEIIPTLDLPENELKQFAHDVIERFQNPFIRHELISIALNSISKFKVRVLPSMLQYAALRKELPHRLAFSLAALIRFYKGEWKGESIALNDDKPVMELFKDAWNNLPIGEIPARVLSNISFWDEDLTRVPGLESAVTSYLINLDQKGIEAALDEL